MKSRWFLIPVVILILALFSSLSLPVAAATPPVKLALGGSGATGWNIGGIKPGDHGTQLITVMNSGTETGDLTVWVSNIVNTEGTNPKFEPSPGSGDLGSYITFSIVSGRISSNIAMPSLVNSLPQSAGDSRYIKVLSLAAGETISINWNWSLPSGTGNIVQGDSLSLTINYALEEISPPPAPPAPISTTGVTTPTSTTPVTTSTPDVTPPTPTSPVAASTPGVTPTPLTPSVPPSISCVSGSVQLVSPDNTVALGVLFDNSTSGPNTAAFFDNKLTLQFDANTKITLSNGQSPETIGVSIVQNSPAANTGTVNISPIYQISDGYDSGGNYREVYFDRPVTISLRYDPAAVPKNATSVYIAYYEEKPDDPNPVWVRLEYPQDYVPESGQISGLLSHLSLFTVIAEVSPSVQSQVPLPVPPAQVQPANVISKSVWVFPAVLAVIEAAVLIYFVIILLKRRKYQKLYNTSAAALNIPPQTKEEGILYTIKHRRRVAELASAIAREMKLPKKLVKMLLMFDIIRDSGLGELPYPVAQTAVQYNTKLNGSGYPQKLVGDDILLEARILAVADTMETISSPRPYHPAMRLDQALEELKRNNSALYDSEVVKALIRLVKRGNFKFRTHYI
jgi:HD domain